MKKLINALVVVFIITNVSTIAQVALTASYGTSTGDEGSCNYVVGQVFCDPGIGNNYTIIPGTFGNQLTPSKKSDIETNKENQTIKVFPNPVSNSILLELNKFDFTKEYIFKLFDVSGKKIIEKRINKSQKSINISFLPASVYLINIIENSKLIKKFKIIKK